MINAVLFDLDGTLLDTNELIYESHYNTFKNKLNMELSREEITSQFGVPLEDSYSVYVKDKDKLKEVVEYYKSYNMSIHDNMCNTFSGVKEMLQELKDNNIKIGIVTSKRSELAKRGMEIACILEYMDVIVTPESTEKHKPNPEPVLKACEELDLDPKEVIMVGDSHYDLRSGKKAGCITVGVEYTVLDINLLKGEEPDYFIKKPEELLEIIKGR